MRIHEGGTRVGSRSTEPVTPKTEALQSATAGASLGRSADAFEAAAPVATRSAPVPHIATWSDLAGAVTNGSMSRAQRDAILGSHLTDPALKARLDRGGPPSAQEAMQLSQAVARAWHDGALSTNALTAIFGSSVAFGQCFASPLDALPKEAPPPSTAVKYWQNGMQRRGYLSPALVQSLAEPTGTLHRILHQVGVEISSGTNYQPALGDVHATHALPDERSSFLPMALYEVDAAQLKELERYFPLDTGNLLSTGLGQTQNRGLVVNDPHNENRKTLWRMAVYEVEGQPGRFRVGFYGETLPDWATGQGMIHVGGVKVGYRAGADTEVGKPIPPHITLVDELLRRIGLQTA